MAFTVFDGFPKPYSKILRERQALPMALNANSFEDNSWAKGLHCEILNNRGLTVFDVGFATAIRKCLRRFEAVVVCTKTGFRKAMRCPVQGLIVELT